jgi:hypothetical protein
MKIKIKGYVAMLCFNASPNGWICLILNARTEADMATPYMQVKVPKNRNK